jgi:hypothetical protein
MSGIKKRMRIGANFAVIFNLLYHSFEFSIWVAKFLLGHIEGDL